LNNQNIKSEADHEEMMKEVKQLEIQILEMESEKRLKDIDYDQRADFYRAQ
jgi:hypothetical protein